MRKVICTIDVGGNLTDKNGVIISAGFDSMSFSVDDADLLVSGEVLDISQTDVVKLVGLGVTPDDLIKMKASGIL